MKLLLTEEVSAPFVLDSAGWRIANQRWDLLSSSLSWLQMGWEGHFTARDSSRDLTYQASLIPRTRTICMVYKNERKYAGSSPFAWDSDRRYALRGVLSSSLKLFLLFEDIIML
ncbi:hypothetical protein R1flu_011177 [Riccia fluitans]|uniref:Uncharacterized protein n=1 Tax=Riccia fluitans TaxID=41844 RepID=A0ABD1Z730_9MARC